MAKEAFTVLICSAVIYLTWALNVDIPATSYEFARGDNVIIPCTFKPQRADNPTVTIVWTAYADVDTDPDIDIIAGFFNTNDQPVIDVADEYEGRATLQSDVAKGIANLQLSSVTSQESRVFTCKIIIPGDKTGKLSDTTKIIVLVAPSKPICKIEGKAEFYQNINLTCNSAEGTPKPTYQWSSFDVRNTSRPNPPKSTDVNGVLSLYNISKDTSGSFICTSSNKIRSESCIVILDVKPPSMNSGRASRAHDFSDVCALVLQVQPFKTGQLVNGLWFALLIFTFSFFL